MRIQTMRLLTRNYVRNFRWRCVLAEEIERELEREIKLRIEFGDDDHEWTDQGADDHELVEALEYITEICILIEAAVELSVDMNATAAENYIASLEFIDKEIIGLADICMEIYGVLSPEKCKEYADRIIAGESMFTTA